MDDEALCDSEEEVFCGPVTGRELELMTRRKLWFRKTEVFKQKTPRKGQRFRRQSSDTGSDEEETQTKASTSGWKNTDPITVEDEQFRSEDIGQDCVRDSNKTCGTLAPPPTPEPCVDVYKSASPKGLKQMIHIDEANETTVASPITKHSSTLWNTCEPDVGMERLQALEAAETKSGDVFVDDALMDILENITDCGFSSDSIDTSYEEEVYYTGEIDLQDKNESEINISHNHMERVVVVPGLKTNAAVTMKGCVSYTTMTNDSLKPSVMSDGDSLVMSQFCAELGQYSHEGVRMSRDEIMEAAVEVVMEDCDMEDLPTNVQSKGSVKVCKSLEFHNGPHEDAAIASVAQIKESFRAVDTSETSYRHGEDSTKLDQSIDTSVTHIEQEGLAGLGQSVDTSLTVSVQDEDPGELVESVDTLVTLCIQDEDLAELAHSDDIDTSLIVNIQYEDLGEVLESADTSLTVNIQNEDLGEVLESADTSLTVNIQNEDLGKVVESVDASLAVNIQNEDLGEVLESVDTSLTVNIQDIDDRKLVDPHELVTEAVNSDEVVAADLNDQSNICGMSGTDSAQRELKEPMATLDNVNVQVENKETNKLSVCNLHIKNDEWQELSKRIEVFGKYGRRVVHSHAHLESSIDNLEQMMGQIKSLNTSSNVVSVVEQTCAVSNYTGRTKNTLEDQEQTTASMEIIHQEGKCSDGLKTYGECDHEVYLNDSTNKEDTFNDTSTSTFQNRERPSFVNVRKKKYSTFFRSSTEDENEVQSSVKDTKESRIPRLYSRTSGDRCSILSTMNDDLIQGRSNIVEHGILASSPTLDKLAEISKKYQHTDEDRTKPEKENYFLNALHRRYGNAKLTTRMSDLSLRSPRNGSNSSLSSLNESTESKPLRSPRNESNSSLSSLNESTENEQSLSATPGTNESHLPLVSKCNIQNFIYSHSDIVRDSESDTEIPESPAVNGVLANYSMISEPEDVTNQVTLGLPQDVKMFSVLNTIQRNEGNGNNMTPLYKRADLRESWSKTLPGNVSSLSADDDGGFLSGFTEIALHHAALQPESSTPKKYNHSVPASVTRDLETNTKENMESDIAVPEESDLEFNDTLEDILLMETYGMDYILGNRDRFSTPHVAADACDKSLLKSTIDVPLRDVQGIDLMVSTKTIRQHSKEHPSAHEIEEYESHSIPIQKCYKSTEESFGEESLQLGDEPDQDLTKSFDSNSSQGRQRFFTDLISVGLTDEKTKSDSTSASPGIIPLTPDTKVVRSMVQPKKFFSDKSSLASGNDNPKIKQASKKEFVFVKPKTIVQKPQANYNHETTPIKKPLLNKLKSPGVKVIGQCPKGFVSPVSDKLKPAPNSGSSSVSRIPRKSVVTTPSGVKKNPIFSKIQSPIGAYIKNSPTPSLVTNKNMPVVSASKQIKAPATSSTQKKRLFTDILSLKEGRSVHYGSENIDTNNIGSVLPQVSYQSAPSLKLDTPSKMKMPHISDSLKRLVEVPMTRVLKHEGRVKVSTINSSGDGKRSPQRFMPRFIPSNPNESCVVVNNHDAEISVVVSKEVTRTDTIGH